MPAPELVAFVDGVAWARVRAPERFGHRSWALGVVAVQLTVEEGRVGALVRAGVTGSEPSVRRFERALVQVALAPPPPLPQLTIPPLEGAAARVALFLDEEPLDAVAISPAALDPASHPPGTTPPRAFGHVYCRFLRDGGIEPGFDLTDFLALPPGEKYARRVSRALEAGQVVSYAISVA